MKLSGYVYRCSGGESFDSIALKIYGDERYAAELLWANPERGEKLVFSGGEVIKLPEVEIPEEDGENRGTKAPWKE